MYPYADSDALFVKRHVYEETKDDSLEAWMRKYPYQVEPLEHGLQSDSNSSAMVKTSLEYKFNEKYTGEVVNGIRHGYGMYYYRNGDVYEGQWKNGFRHGVGKFIEHDGSFYVGEFRNGNKQG